MNSSRVLELLDTIDDRLTALRELVIVRGYPYPRVLQARWNLARWADITLPGSGEGTSRGASHSDPVLAAITKAEGIIDEHTGKTHHDEDTITARQAAIDAANLDASIDEAALALARAIDLVTRATITKYHAPNNDPGCKNCARAHRRDGSLHPRAYQRAISGIRQGTPRCSWCRDFFADYGVEPDLELVEWHLEHPGEKRPLATIRRLHPKEYDRAHGTHRRR